MCGKNTLIPSFMTARYAFARGSDGRQHLEIDGRPSKFFNIKALTFLGGMGRNAGELATATQGTYEESAPLGSMYAKERLQLLDRENLAAALIYPSIGLTWECE